MKLSDAGESRLRGYLYVFERSMRSSTVPRAVVADAVREVESHVRDRVEELDQSVVERDALEGILVQLGPPARVAQAYSLELVLDEANTTGRLLSIGRALLRLSMTGLVGFSAAFGLFSAYLIGGSFLLVAALKPIFPSNVGLWVKDGLPRSFGGQFPAPTDMDLVGGYLVIPISIAMGCVILYFTHRAARSWIGRIRQRRADAKLLAVRLS